MNSQTSNHNELTKIELSCEPLEQRMMLSTVTIFAAGATGEESLDLIVDGEVAYTYEQVRGDIDSRTFEVYKFEGGNQFTVDDIQLRFTNDLYDPEAGIDRNIVVDKIIVDGVTYETESPSTHADAWWGNGGFQENGNFETETMNVNSTFTFSSESAPVFGSQGTRIRIQANGDTGEERFALRLDDETVKGFRAGTEEMAFFHRTSGAVDPSDIKIAFVNDLYDPEKGVDRNLTVRQIQLIDIATGERTIFETDSFTVLSTGTWLPDDGVARGFGRGDTLNSNGFFLYGQDPTAVRGRPLSAVLAQFERQNAGTVNPVVQENTEYFDNQGREYLVAGSRGNAQEILVVRLLANGLVDPSYGLNGLSVIPLEQVVSADGAVTGQATFEATKLAFDSQNRAYAVSSITANVSSFRNIRTQWFGTQVSRLISNGIFDGSFANGGVGVVPYVEGTSTNVRSIEVDDNDQLKVTGNKVAPITSFFLGEFTGVAEGLTTLTLVQSSDRQIDLVEA